LQGGVAEALALILKLSLSTPGEVRVLHGQMSIGE
jgi:hypothetical protein